MYRLIVFSCIVLLCACSRQQQKENRKPNFIIIFTDDQGYQDLCTDL